MSKVTISFQQNIIIHSIKLMLVVKILLVLQFGLNKFINCLLKLYQDIHKEIIPNLCVGEGGKLSNMGETQKSFFQVCKILRFEKHNGPGIAPKVLHPAKDMTRSVFIIFTGVEARLPFAKAGCPTESPVELLEKLWIPGPYSRTTELIFWLYK